ncbi:MAG: YgjV family protein [Nitrososphaerota archaeon]|jgi:hypothetical protein|nr:YgjV family protein [Nitrososphaerota archaeon]
MPSYFASFWFKKAWFLVLTIFTSVLYAVGYILMSAWSGLCFAALSASICLLVYYLDKRKDKLRHYVKSIRYVGFGLALSIGLFVSIFFDRNMLAIVLAIGAGLNYYNYFLMRENDARAKIIFIVSHALIVIYEFFALLYFFALMDLLATVSIAISLSFLCYTSRKRRIVNKIDCLLKKEVA